MNGQVFVDTGAWYALQVLNDRWHREAVATLKKAVARGTPLVTTNEVVGETYTLLLKTHGHSAAWRFVDSLQRSSRLQLARVDDGAEREAWELLRRFADQAFSFVDGTSFAFMRKHRMRHAFAFDRHFAAAGFLRIPLDGEVP
jgi:uncharacterized protein